MEPEIFQGSLKLYGPVLTQLWQTMSQNQFALNSRALEHNRCQGLEIKAMLTQIDPESILLFVTVP